MGCVWSQSGGPRWEGGGALWGFKGFSSYKSWPRCWPVTHDLLNVACTKGGPQDKLSSEAGTQSKGGHTGLADGCPQSVWSGWDLPAFPLPFHHPEPQKHSLEIALLFQRYFHWEEKKNKQSHPNSALPLKGTGNRKQSLDKKSSKTNLILLLGTRMEVSASQGLTLILLQLHPVPSVSKVPHSAPLPSIYSVPRFYVLFLSSADSMDLVGSFKGFNEFF